MTFFSVPSHFQVYKIKIRYEILNDESTAEEYDWNTQIHADQHIHGNKTSVENKKAHTNTAIYLKKVKKQCAFLKQRFAAVFRVIQSYVEKRICHVFFCLFRCVLWWRVKLLIWTCRCLSSVEARAPISHSNTRNDQQPNTAHIACLHPIHSEFTATECVVLFKLLRFSLLHLIFSLWADFFERQRIGNAWIPD